MNNLGSREQGLKIFNQVMSKLDKSAQLNSIVLKDGDYWNFRKYISYLPSHNRILKKTINMGGGNSSNIITFTMRNLSGTYRNVSVKKKPTTL